MKNDRQVFLSIAPWLEVWYDGTSSVASGNHQERRLPMAIEKVGIYRRWLESVPQRNGESIPKSEWPKTRRHSWTVRWFGTAGKRYSKDFTTKKPAEGFARNIQARVNERKQDRPKRIALHDFSMEHNQVMKGQVAYATLLEQMRALRLFEKFIGGSVMVHEIKPRDAEAFIASRLTVELATATINKDIRTLRRVFNLAIHPRGYLLEGQNPFGRMKQRKKACQDIRYISVAEYRLLRDAAKSLWWRSLMALAYGSGLRRGEILNLTWTDVDFGNKQVHVRSKRLDDQTIGWEPKDHENRVVPLSDEALNLLVDLRAQAEAGYPYLFIWPARLRHIQKRLLIGRWNERSEVINNLGRDYEVIRRRAGVDACTLHDLRRSAITNWANKLPIQVVQQLAGHSNISTTRKYYLSVRPDDIVSASAVINGLLATKGVTQK
jgi:integrase